MAEKGRKRGERLEPLPVSLIERRLRIADGDRPLKKPCITTQPKSRVLKLVTEFLPKLKEEQQQLDLQMKNNPRELDIEHMNDDAQCSQVIEMSIECGVLDLLNEESVAAAEKAIQSGDNGISEVPRWLKDPGASVSSLECSSSLCTDSSDSITDGVDAGSLSRLMAIQKGHHDPQSGNTDGLDCEGVVVAAQKENSLITELS